MAPMERARVAVIGATGYIGMQCVALLSRHPNVELTALVGRSAAGQRYADAVPGSPITDHVVDGFDPGNVDIVVAALPHTVAASSAAGWLAAGAIVVDLSADFRIHDVAVYERWYRVVHPAPELLGRAVYALPELHADAIRSADILAAPGCYPTATLHAVVPALAAGLIEPDVTVSAMSGVSGAGRSPGLGTHFAEVNESVHAYGVAGHRHSAEMRQEMAAACGEEVRLVFVPHLVPMTRGILATAFLRPRQGVDPAEIVGLYANWCDERPFLRWDPTPPRTRTVTGTNLCALNASVQEGTVVVTAAIDNLMRGAASQAVQALNLRMGWPETTGLDLQPSWP